MSELDKRPLKVFLCHASGDKPLVIDLYDRLVAEGVDAWLDKEKLLPGQDWHLEIPRAVRESDVVVVCLSRKSVTKEGYIQKEIRFALDIAKEKPEGTIFLVPARLEECLVPERLSRWQWVDLFDDGGFLKLLRTLKLRATIVDAIIEPPEGNKAIDKETQVKLDQFYTEGLAAFWVEDWDKARQRFQSILFEQPDHKEATEKLVETDLRRNLATLYFKAMDAISSENWSLAVKTLEQLLQKSTDYKDADQLLKTAKKQKLLKDLYAQAKTLHDAQKWQAVAKIFEQISIIEPSYSDPENLRASAQKEVDKLKRLSWLNDLYSQGVRQMDAGEWGKAFKFFDQVRKEQPSFLETDRLLKITENKIQEFETRRRRNDQIHILYEQANGLARSKKWREAMEKIEEIREIDGEFDDPENIVIVIKNGLIQEENDVERQNQLASLYAEAVRLLKDGKYQDSLDKWQEVKLIDPKYPDRQRIQYHVRKRPIEINKVSREGNRRFKLYFVSSAILIVFVGFILIYNNLDLLLPFVVGPTSQVPQSAADPTATPQFIETITIPSDINTGVTYKVKKTGAYLIKFNDSTSAVWNGDGIHWITQVLAFPGAYPQWVGDDPGLDYEKALFYLGGFDYTSKEQALSATKNSYVRVGLSGGDLISFIVSDGKQYYSDNSGEIILDIILISNP